MSRKEKEKHLNAMAREWKSMPETGNEAQRVSLRWEIYILAAEDVFKAQDDGTEQFINVLMEAMERYDPAQGDFCNYLSFVLSRRKKDAYQDVLGRTAQTDSLEKSVTDDGELTVGDTLRAEETSDPAALAQVSAPLAELAALILNFAKRHQGRSANETRRNWYRLFYTEDMTKILKTIEVVFLHERDVFQAMKVAYLDYYMAGPCRSMAQITDTPLKPYGQVVPERAGTETETPLPIPADVSLSYLRLRENTPASPAARSNQYSFYKAEREQIFRGDH